MKNDFILQQVVLTLKDKNGKRKFESESHIDCLLNLQNILYFFISLIQGF